MISLDASTFAALLRTWVVIVADIMEVNLDRDKVNPALESLLVQVQKGNLPNLPTHTQAKTQQEAQNKTAPAPAVQVPMRRVPEDLRPTIEAMEASQPPQMTEDSFPQLRVNPRDPRLQQPPPPTNTME